MSLWPHEAATRASPPHARLTDARLAASPRKADVPVDLFLFRLLPWQRKRLVRRRHGDAMRPLITANSFHCHPIPILRSIRSASENATSNRGIRDSSDISLHFGNTLRNFQSFEFCIFFKTNFNNWFIQLMTFDL